MLQKFTDIGLCLRWFIVAPETLKWPDIVLLNTVWSKVDGPRTLLQDATGPLILKLLSPFPSNKSTSSYNFVIVALNQLKKKFLIKTAFDNDRLLRDRRVLHPVTTSDNEWQWVTMNGNEWQRVLQRVTANDSEWYNEWQRITMSGTTSGTTSDNEWQQIAITHSEWHRVVQLMKTGQYT